MTYHKIILYVPQKELKKGSRLKFVKLFWQSFEPFLHTKEA